MQNVVVAAKKVLGEMYAHKKVDIPDNPCNVGPWELINEFYLGFDDCSSKTLFVNKFNKVFLLTKQGTKYTNKNNNKLHTFC